MANGTIVAEATVALREWLVSSNFEDGARIPSERALASQLGFNHHALNRAILRLIGEGMLVRVGYKLFYTAQAQVEIEYSCDLVVSRASVLLKSYCKVAKELGIQLTVHLWFSMAEAVDILDQLDNPKTRCVLFDPPFVYGVPLWEPAMCRLNSHGIPTICFHRYTPSLPCVSGDSMGALEMAFSYLYKLGHQEMSLLINPPSAPGSLETLNAWESLCLQHNCRASGSRTYYSNRLAALRENMNELARKLTEEWSGVTALLIDPGSAYDIQDLLNELNRRHRCVPKDLSLICLGDDHQSQTSTPLVSAVAYDLALMQETAFRMLQRMVRKKTVSGFLPQTCCIWVEPALVLRASTAPPASPIRPTKPKKRARISSFQIEGNENSIELKSVLLRPYPHTTLVHESRFEQIKLAQYVNRPLHLRHGWLGGLPLKHFPAGKQVIHGIPFEVLGGPKRTDCGGIVFHSTTNVTGSGRELPQHLMIPIGLKASAIYVLHGCGYAEFLHAFATYSFYSKKKKLGEVSLVSLGNYSGILTDEEWSKASHKANIQDWWTDFPQLDFPHARRVPINEGDEGSPHHVFLYTLEWINPFPEEIITHMEVSVDPSQSTTLGILSVSALRK